MIITSPGFYTSKAGKCEVVSIENGYALGWDAERRPAVWIASTGNSFQPCFRDDIVSAFTEPRKPVEAWSVYWGDTAGGVEDWAYYRKRLTKP